MDSNCNSDAQKIFNFYQPYFRANVSDLEKGKQRFYVPVCPINVIVSLCETVKAIFANEPMLLRLNDEPVVIVGDLHGHILDLFRTFGRIGLPPEKTFLFLGDIVDRGEFSTESITLIFALKILYPKNIYIIRGNHEFLEMSRQCGFSAELSSLYNTANTNPIAIMNQQQQNGYINNNNNNNNNSNSINTMMNINTSADLAENVFMDAFSQIPIAALIGTQVLCVHGGLGPQVYEYSQLEKIPRPLDNYNEEIVASLLWSDPSRFGKDFEPSTRGLGYFFGPDALADFLNRNSLKYIVRGHECVDNGIEMQLGRRMFTVFGASNYCGLAPNKAGVLIMKPQDATKECVYFQAINHPKRANASFVTSESPNEFAVRRPGGFIMPPMMSPSSQNMPPMLPTTGGGAKLPQLKDSPKSGSRVESRQRQKRSCETELKQKIPRRVPSLIGAKRLKAVTHH